jgi:hypothetical protein
MAFAVVMGGSAGAQSPSRPPLNIGAPPLGRSESKDSAASAPAAPLSRGELLRRFDLNFDGTIDEAEGQLGRAKMRREREEEERQRQMEGEIDPVTGRPRGEAKEGQKPQPPKRRIISIDDLLPGNADATDTIETEGSALGRGMSTRDGKGDLDDPAGVGRTRHGSLSGGAAPKGATGKPPAPTGTGSGRPGAISGGVRAGAPPARPGYGAPAATNPTGTAKPSRSLNAGRPVGSLPPAAAKARPGAPAGNAPGTRTGQAIGNSAAGQPPAQPPARPQTGRSSAPQTPAVAPRTPLFPPRPIN